LRVATGFFKGRKFTDTDFCAINAVRCDFTRGVDEDFVANTQHQRYDRKHENILSCDQSIRILDLVRFW
jgi:hypothetical protein